MPIVNFKDSINKCNTVFCLSLSVSELGECKKTLENILADKDLSQTLRENGEALSLRLNAKILSLKYFEDGYLQGNYEELCKFLKENLPIAEKKGFTKTVLLFNSLKKFAADVDAIMNDAVELVYGVRDSDGNLTTSDLARLTDFEKSFSEKLGLAEQLEYAPRLFGERVKTVDFKESLINTVKAELVWIKEKIEELKFGTAKTFIDENTQPLESVFRFCDYVYFPVMPEDNGENAKAIVLLSPLYDEIYLYVSAYAEKHSLKFVVLDANVFNGKTSEYIETAFSAFETSGKSLVINGLARYRDENVKVIEENALKFSKKDGVVFCTDDIGNRTVYDDMYGVAKATEGLLGTDVAYKYLTMPDFDGVIKEFEEKGMITPSDRTFVRENMAFMGFTGLNAAVNAFAVGGDWKSRAIGISKENRLKASAYLRNIPSQIQFIDFVWVDLAIKEKEDKNRKEFDYDAIREVSRANVKKILNLNESIFVKCGLVVQYCCLGGEDLSVWQQIPIEDKEKRINDATVLVSYLLSTEYTPFVDVVPKAEWKDDAFGGLCCDGGKRILYREDCVENYEWLIDAVCHECYHSFQHTLNGLGWKRWHYDELGVSAERVYEWSYNFNRYKNKGDAYKIQIVEADARIFAKRCITSSLNKWHLIDLE